MYANKERIDDALVRQIIEPTDNANALCTFCSVVWSPSSKMSFDDMLRRIGEREKELPVALVYGKEDPWVVPLWGQRLKRALPHADYYELSPPVTVRRRMSVDASTKSCARGCATSKPRARTATPRPRAPPTASPRSWTDHLETFSSASTRRARAPAQNTSRRSRRARFNRRPSPHPIARAVAPRGADVHIMSRDRPVVTADDAAHYAYAREGNAHALYRYEGPRADLRGAYLRLLKRASTREDTGAWRCHPIDALVWNLDETTTTWAAADARVRDAFFAIERDDRDASTSCAPSSWRDDLGVVRVERDALCALVDATMAADAFETARRGGRDGRTASARETVGQLSENARRARCFVETKGTERASSR